MSIIKVGDKVLLEDGDTGEVIEINKALTVKVYYENYHYDRLLFENEVKKLNNEYLNSNRYKLKQLIKDSGFTAADLSLALGKNKWYLSTETKESQFNSRGDISDIRLGLLVSDIESLLSAHNEIEISGTCKPKLDLEPKDGYHNKFDKFHSIGSNRAAKKIKSQKPNYKLLICLAIFTIIVLSLLAFFA